CLVGAATSVIEPYTLRTQNYEVVIAALKKRYERPAAIKQLERLPTAKEGNLRTTIEAIDRIIELLRFQEEDKIEYEKSEWTVPILRDRLATFVIAEGNVANILGYASKEPYSPYWDTIDIIMLTCKQHGQESYEEHTSKSSNNELSSFDCMQPLRPMDFLSSQGYAVSPLPIQREELSTDSHNRDYLLNYWKEGATIADKFWEKWQTQYLQTLRKQREHKGPHAQTRRIPKRLSWCAQEQNPENAGLWHTSPKDDEDKELSIRSRFGGRKRCQRAKSRLITSSVILFTTSRYFTKTSTVHVHRTEPVRIRDSTCIEDREVNDLNHQERKPLLHKETGHFNYGIFELFSDSILAQRKKKIINLWLN
uniref:DUF5641 domain-containing protein n=1 Tax=Brugia pahangi TaxID=6280 RepID=A0A0N4T773_BRUPA